MSGLYIGRKWVGTTTIHVGDLRVAMAAHCLLKRAVRGKGIADLPIEIEIIPVQLTRVTKSQQHSQPVS